MPNSYCVGEVMVTTFNENMFAPEIIYDPYTYYGSLRDEDPVHWNELYELWVITRHDDLVWLTRNHELFSSAVWLNDPRGPYPAINESDNELYEFVRNYQGKQFIQYDRPDHLEMRKGRARLLHAEVHGRVAAAGEERHQRAAG